MNEHRPKILKVSIKERDKGIAFINTKIYCRVTVMGTVQFGSKETLGASLVC